MRRALLLGCSLACAVALGCGGAAAQAGWRSRPGTVEARGYLYTDNSGLDVKTYAVTAEQPVSRATTLSMRAVADDVVLSRTSLAGSGSIDGMHAPDAVTSASSTAGGGAVAAKWRFEGIGGVETTGTTACGQPWSVRVSGRVSHETDYLSFAGLVHGTIELFDRNTALSGFVGAGHDTITPVADPPGQAALWPATHDRVNGGAAVSQLVSPTMVVSGGTGFTWQQGELANPYRRAVVKTSLFPETVPDRRLRLTGFVGLSWSIDPATALHLRAGAYVDTWGVVAAIPEGAAVRELPFGVVATVRYRYYRQGAAAFYEPAYTDLRLYVSGDERLGRIHEHLFGGELRGAVHGIGLAFGYDLSLLDYEQLGTPTIVAHVFNVGVSGSY